MGSITVNGKEAELLSKCISDLIRELQLDENAVAVVKNGKIIKKEDWKEENLQDGDAVEVFSPVSGG
jgi:thiamine biosynthesis protein ThiS